MRTVTLDNGIEMPILGFGVFQIPDPEECENSVLEALRTGYRLIDTAAAYGNEEAVGRAIRRSGVPRAQVFLTTKLWIQDAGYERAKKAFDRSTRKLGVDYLDLYLIHQPFGDVHGAWRAMEELHAQGRVRAIGVSNFQPDRLMDLMAHNKIAPAVNQIETHPFQQQSEAHQFLRQNQVQIQSWGPFAEGRNGIFDHPLLLSLARKHGKSVAQVILRWLIQREVVVIPKSVRRERIAENFDIFGFALSTDDMEAIRALDTGKSLFFDHRDPAMVKWLAERKLEL
ncbi:MAG TPA: aldo/keto reductase [Ramlibacter sp.]|nr:aldo/keto reductase [Ramlibacter sp.]